ncbi:MAG: Gfo/Idh/MocA family oxidoreductase, partial [Alphaproteobacteria bacterium]|nr:Gfo/Idh/MocA family oxidoreductase [Alphaproteobacteria bacterium]
MTSVVIAGLGRIGVGNKGLAGEIPLSHLSAAMAVPGVRVVGLVDAAPARLDEIRGEYSSQFANVAMSESLSALDIERCDVVVIATPPEFRLAAVEEALSLKPKLLLLEKPVASDLVSTRRVVEAIESAGTNLRVNFHRRFDQRHLQWRQWAPPKPALITMRYGKGLMNYGSHLIDLLMDWYGPVETVQSMGDLRPTAHGNDYVLSFRCRMSKGFDAFILGLDGLQYDQHEIDIFAPEGRLEIAAGGAEFRWHRPVPDKHYIGYDHLEADCSTVDIGPVGGFREIYQAIHDFITNDAELPGCTGTAAVANSVVIDAALRSAAARN